jgi:hypothetical protein
LLSRFLTQLPVQQAWGRCLTRVNIGQKVATASLGESRDHSEASTDLGILHVMACRGQEAALSFETNKRGGNTWYLTAWGLSWGNPELSHENSLAVNATAQKLVARIYV